MIYSLDWLKAPPIRNIVAKNTVTDDLLPEAIFSSERFAVKPQLSGMTWYKLNAVNWTNRDINRRQAYLHCLGLILGWSTLDQNVAFKKGSGIQEISGRNPKALKTVLFQPLNFLNTEIFLGNNQYTSIAKQNLCTEEFD